MKKVSFIGAQIDMKFKIDKRYIAIQSLKAIVCYILGVLIVLNLLDLETPMDFVGTSLFAAIILYFVFIYPRNILIKLGVISFVENNCFKRINVNLINITNIKYSFRFYNTLIITTKEGKQYKLHPKDAQELENVINSYK